MAVRMDRTCWRGIRIDHPAEWELAVASGVDEPRRCAFADRLFHRLDVRWRPLKGRPNLELAIQKHRRQTDKGAESTVTDFADAPAGWRGTLRKTGEATLAYACRYLESPGWLVDAVVVWPQKRDKATEAAVLRSIGAEDPGAEVREWQAMGLSLRLGRPFELVRSLVPVGQVRWEFSTARRHGPQLVIERLAMPEHWLGDSLREWLLEELPHGHRPHRQELAKVNGHRAERLISHTRFSPLASLRGIREIRVDLAWLCPKESRLYRVSFADRSRADEIALPGSLEIRCCRDVPAAARGRSA